MGNDEDETVSVDVRRRSADGAVRGAAACSTARSSRSTRTAGPPGFQRLQGRMHLAGAKDVERAEQAQPAALIVFDIMRDGEETI